MLFNSWTFLVFFAVVYAVYLLVKGTPLRLPWLLLVSYVFYGWWNPVYLLLILWATTIDYLAVVAMARTPWKKPWLALSLANNLGLLGFFKYGQFLVENLNALAGWSGSSYTVPQPNVGFLSTLVNGVLDYLNLGYQVPEFKYGLPVAMSFYVFQSLTYTVDFYRGKIQREPSFLRYATFVALFPQLLSGPIERAGNILPQLRSVPRITAQDAADGISLFIVGLFKKIALADCLAVYVNPVYAAPAEYQAPALVSATVAYAWQIYFDFSGYTDMARGVARAMGIRLMLNFNHPYLATGLGDFWRRWHISLSTWFKDYLYIPLGGNRHGELRTYVNMTLTMLISGFWHGAMWTFILWGAIHAAGRILTRALEGTPFYRDRVPTFAKQMLTFAIVTFAWIFFRAASISDAWLIVGRIAAGTLGDPRLPLLMAGLVLSVWLYQYVHESRFQRLLQPAPVRIGLVIGMILYMAAFVTSSGQGFIYFQF